MLSGLEPRDVLSQHGIRTKLDVPGVGQNLNDHILLFLNWRLRDPLKAYALESSQPRWGELQYAMGMPGSYVVSTTGPEDGLRAARQRDGTHISTAPMGMKPTSRGTVSIASGDVADLPVLDPNYYSTEADKYVWRTSLRRIAQLMTGDTPLGREVAGETPPAGEPLSATAPDEYLDGRMKNQAISMFHGSGSCAMGTVVDSELRVKGVQNLRIVDASVFPVSIGAHIQAATYALAEQAAVLISTAT